LPVSSPVSLSPLPFGGEAILVLTKMQRASEKASGAIIGALISHPGVVVVALSAFPLFHFLNE